MTDTLRYRHLLIRADATAKLGSGHVMRTLALAQAWRKNGGTVSYLCRDIYPLLATRLAAEGFELQRFDAADMDDDCRQTAVAATQRAADWIVVDGYAFTPSYYDVLGRLPARILQMDDYGGHPEYGADIVLNQNLGAPVDAYVNRRLGSRLLLGARYTMLRAEFLQLPPPKAPVSPGRKQILLMLGGTDPTNSLPRILEGMMHRSDCDIVAITGHRNEAAQATLKSIASQASARVTLTKSVDQLPSLMQRTDVAVTAAGSTCWELAYLGVPMLVIPVAKNQLLLATNIHQHALGQNLGWYADVTSQDVRAAFDAMLDEPRSRAPGKRIIDGKGAERVVQAMQLPPLQIRPVGEGDRKRLWQWRNDDVVRQAAFSTDPVPYDDHCRWFAAKRAQETCHFYICETNDGEPVGQIRFEREGEGAEIHFALAAEARGRGLAPAVIDLAVQKFERESTVKWVIARIKPDNLASVRSFENALFVKQGEEEVNGSRGLLFQRDRLCPPQNAAA